MGKKNKSSVPDESHLILPLHPSALSPSPTSPPPSIVDTHTHLLSTFSAYKSKYSKVPDVNPKFETVFDFARGICSGRNVEAIVDVWCEAPVQKAAWKEIADSAVTPDSRKQLWGGVEYWFVMGVHPHESKLYTDEVEADILEAMAHPRCVGWGEIGLDYHYDLSDREIQRAVFARQLRHAVRLGKPLTIHTREAEDDTERILKEEVPSDWKIHIHCFTDSPDFAERLLDHFPNLYIGITGVITYATNLNTSEIVRRLVKRCSSSPVSDPVPLRILLETDAPYMIPGNIYKSLQALKSGARLPLCHTGMIPWTAEFVAGVAVAGEADASGNEVQGTAEEWDAVRVMREARGNARSVYGV